MTSIDHLLAVCERPILLTTQTRPPFDSNNSEQAIRARLSVAKTIEEIRAAYRGSPDSIVTAFEVSMGQERGEGVPVHVGWRFGQEAGMIPPNDLGPSGEVLRLLADDGKELLSRVDDGATPIGEKLLALGVSELQLFNNDPILYFKPEWNVCRTDCSYDIGDGLTQHEFVANRESIVDGDVERLSMRGTLYGADRSLTVRNMTVVRSVLYNQVEEPAEHRPGREDIMIKVESTESGYDQTASVHYTKGVSAIDGTIDVGPNFTVVFDNEGRAKRMNINAEFPLTAGAVINGQVGPEVLGNVFGIDHEARLDYVASLTRLADSGRSSERAHDVLQFQTAE